jgi:hypothetical protein
MAGLEETSFIELQMTKTEMIDLKMSENEC